ncbi:MULTISPECIES: hypothetical protein [Bradyrhizobium]|uniref:hypothetical protein n=1 Tax=Bradyrhizobium TaxID=374 RepID=UPI001EDAE9D9|nr:hypothetical protein [Bradyrhizobium zhengyangense]MCG2639419.1 hypothetical protein [Bradyrhizobium zhengyangense]
MKVIPDALWGLASQSKFHAFHQGCHPNFFQHLERFLTATMDEVRLTASNRVVLEVLSTIGVADFGQFRDAVLRREISGTIEYEKQRDHSSHTLYNYLLGWYFFLHSRKLRDALAVEFRKRGVPNAAHPTEPFQTGSAFFGCVWQYVSLLHDIGYMFEGGLARMSLEDSSKQAELGAHVARHYFNRAIWLDYNIDLVDTRKRLFNELGGDLAPPKFDRTGTLGDIADGLRTVGGLNELFSAVNSSLPPAVTGPELADFSGDSFDLWAHHYERFGNPGMARRFRSLRKVFNGLIDSGLPKPKVRILDHGVGGGLLQLLASTYYYRLRAAALQVNPPTPLVQKVIDAGGWSPTFWWTGVVWGTAASALHNVQQQDDANELDPEWPGKLALDDDPIAYLGILVDVIQEWNRYSVFKRLDVDREPIQGIEVELGFRNGKIIVRFKEPNAVDRAKEVRKGLDKSLSAWSDIVEIRP